MFDPNNPIQMQGGPQMQPMGQHPQPLGGPQMMPPQQVGAPGQQTNALMPQRPMFDHTAFQALSDPMARHDFRGDWRDSMMQWHTAMDAYRQQNDPRHAGMPGGPVMTPGGGGTGAPPQANNLFPLNPGYQQQMMPNPQAVGQSMYVQGMTPATNPYGMPGY